MAGRRTNSLEARAALLDQAQPATKPPSQHTTNAASDSSSNTNASADSNNSASADNKSNGVIGSSSSADEAEVPIMLPETPTASSAADVMQSADDDLDPNAARAKSHQEVSLSSFQPSPLLTPEAKPTIC